MYELSELETSRDRNVTQLPSYLITNNVTGEYVYLEPGAEPRLGAGREEAHPLHRHQGVARGSGHPRLHSPRGLDRF